jgi:hypothetical protein
MNKVEPKSPRIAQLSWGQIGVEGALSDEHMAAPTSRAIPFKLP